MLLEGFTAPCAPAEPLRDSVWHGQLQLLAGLPYPLLAMAPAIAASLRCGLRADFATLGICDGETLAPTAFWAERIDEPVLHWLSGHTQALFDVTPLGEQLATDGDAVRACFGAPGWSEHPVYRAAFAPLGARWGMAVPLLDRAHRCLGFVYVYRSEAAGPFTDDEQQRLRAARDRLRGLGAPHAPCADAGGRTVPTRTALLRIDAQGRIRARSANAYELLFIGQHQRVGSLAWAAPDLSALPSSVATRCHRLLADPGHAPVDEITLHADGGGMRYQLQRLVCEGADGAELVVRLCHLEPLDLAVARQLIHWPLTPRERQLAVASARASGQREMAQMLGCSVGTLKGYLHSLYAKVGVTTREALINRLLGSCTAKA